VIPFRPTEREIRKLSGINGFRNNTKYEEDLFLYLEGLGSVACAHSELINPEI
jgi:hypothetical protein